MRQPWVPRVMNVSLAVVLLLLVGPIVVNFTGRPLFVQAALLLVTLPALLVAGLCLTSALRPGSLGRAVRRRRAARRATMTKDQAEG